MRKLVAMLCVLGCTVPAWSGILFDQFSDNNYTANPAWVVESGTFAADGSSIGIYYGNYAGPGMLAFVPNSTIHLDFPQVAANSPVTIEFDLFQSHYSYPGDFSFTFQIRDTQSNLGYGIDGILSPTWFGSYDTSELSGFSSYMPSGSFTGGTAGKSLLNGWQHVVIKFDPATGVEMSYAGEVVSSFPNFRGLARIDRLVLSSGGTLSWFVDNVRVATSTTIPQKSSIVIDGNLADWPATSQWSQPYVYWDGAGSSAITQARFAWNNAQDLLYVGIRTNETNGGHAVVGFSKDLAGVPNTGLGSTQLAFDIGSGNTVNIMNEIDWYTTNLIPSPEWPHAGIDGVEAKYSFNSLEGTYTYEIAIPFWQDWRTEQPKVKQPLTVYDTVYVYSVMETGLGTATGTDLSWINNPAFYNGHFEKATALTLDSDPADEGQVLYRDDFNRTDGVLAGSTVSTGGYPWVVCDDNGTPVSTLLNVADKKLSIGSSAWAYRTFYVNCNMDKYENYLVSFDLTVRPHSFDVERDYFYFRGRAAGDTAWYGYRLSYYSWGGPTGIYGYFQSPSQAGDLGATLFEINKPTRITIDVKGNTSTVTIGSTVCATFNELATYNNGTPDYITFGSFFKDTYGEAFTVDNVVVTVPVVNVPGDANHDNAVDVSDLGILAANYGKTAGATWEQGDFNGDHAVDVSDLGILAAHYGTGAGAALDFNADAKAFGLTAGGSETETAKADTPVTSTLGCGSAGLPLILGLGLMGILLVKLEE